MPPTRQRAGDDALRRVLDAAGVPAATLDLEGRLVAVNPAFARACGRAVGELIGLHVLSLCPGRDQADLLAAVVHLVGGLSRIERSELHVVSAEGPVRVLVLTLGTAVDDQDRPVAIHAVAEDVTARRREERRRERGAVRTPVPRHGSGPSDRDAGVVVTEAARRAARDATPYALLACEVTRRDTGPTVGSGGLTSMAVASVAERLCQRLRPHDVVCTPVGDRINVVAERLGDLQDAAGVAYRMLAAMVEPVRVDDREVRLDLVVGVAVGDGGTAPAEVVTAADTALDAARADGVGTFRLEDRRTRRV